MAWCSYFVTNAGFESCKVLTDFITLMLALTSGG